MILLPDEQVVQSADEVRGVCLILLKDDQIYNKKESMLREIASDNLKLNYIQSIKKLQVQQ